MKNVLVTGATGFVGSHMLDYLHKNTTHEIHATKRLNADPTNIKHMTDVQWHDCDLTDPLSCQIVIGRCNPDAIFHFGALSWVTPSWNMPSAYMQTNAIGTINLFEAVMASGGWNTKILVSCTPEEYGYVTKDSIPLTEDSPLAPVNPYAASKMAQDAVCQSYSATYPSVLKIVRTRVFNHEGPRRRSHGAIASFAKQIALIEQGQDPVVYAGNLDVTRNFTDVRDMVEAYYLAMLYGVPGELYLIGSENVFTIRQCLDELIAMSTRKSEIKVVIDPDRVRPTEVPLLIGDYSKFQKLTGWEPVTSFEDTLCSVLNYWRDEVQK